MYSIRMHFACKKRQEQKYSVNEINELPTDVKGNT